MRSVGMLEAARDRIAARAGGTLPEDIMLLQADARDLPLCRESVDTTFSMGVLHLMDDVVSCAEELFRVLSLGGQLFATALVIARVFGRAYLRFLHMMGEIAAPRSREDYQNVLEKVFDGPVSTEREGNMAFLTAETSTTPQGEHSAGKDETERDSAA